MSRLTNKLINYTEIRDQKPQDIYELLEFKPHSTQQQVLNSKARFKVVVAGRRWGKNVLGEFCITSHAFIVPNSLNWWIAPLYRHSKRAYRNIKHKLRKLNLLKHHLDTELRIELNNGSLIEFLSADNPDMIKGEGVDYLHIDECGMIKNVVWYEYITPVLIDKGGRGMFNSTPKGTINWLHEIYNNGLNRKRMWDSFRFTTYDNPTLADMNFIEDMRRSHPEEIFNQEILAQFIEGDGSVFKGLDRIIKGEPSEPLFGKNYFIGVDLARVKDFTAIVVMDENAHVVHYDRVNQINWDSIKYKIMSVVRRYNNALCSVDATGVGDALVEDLQRGGLRIIPYKFTNVTKNDLIQKLIIDVSEQRLSIPRQFEVLIQEMKAYSYKISESGNIKYNAPEGKHDDTVIALALANNLLIRNNFSMDDVIIAEQTAKSYMNNAFVKNNVYMGF